MEERFLRRYIDNDTLLWFHYSVLTAFLGPYGAKYRRRVNT